MKINSHIEAISILEEAGFIVTTTSVSGLGEPQLRLEAGLYQGLAEIRKVVAQNIEKTA